MQGRVRPKEGQLLIFPNNRRLAFVRFMNEMQGKKKLEGISPNGAISDKVTIGRGCIVGDYAVIGDNCFIGDNTVIYDRVSLVQNCIIGKDCIIQSGASARLRRLCV